MPCLAHFPAVCPLPAFALLEYLSTIHLGRQYTQIDSSVTYEYGYEAPMVSLLSPYRRVAVDCPTTLLVIMCAYRSYCTSFLCYLFSSFTLISTYAILILMYWAGSNCTECNVDIDSVSAVCRRIEPVRPQKSLHVRAWTYTPCPDSQ